MVERCSLSLATAAQNVTVPQSRFAALLIGKDGKLNAVLSVGGFLGMGTKYVEVPYSTLTFGNTQKSSDNKVVLKGATKDSLKAQAGFNYYKS